MQSQHLISQRPSDGIGGIPCEEGDAGTHGHHIKQYRNVGAKAARIFVRIRTQRFRDAEEDGIDDAAGARRIGRRYRSDDEIGKGCRIPKTQSRTSEDADHPEGNALAEVGISEGLGDDIGADDEPRHRQRETGKRHGMAAHHDGIKAQENSERCGLTDRAKHDHQNSAGIERE